MDEGSALIEEMLRTWAARCNTSRDGDDDIVMEDEGNLDRELHELKRCVEEYRIRMDSNPWIKELTATL